MKKVYMCVLLAFFFTLPLFSQGVKFGSPVIELVTKQHIGIDPKAEVTTEQLDTITTLDLSGYGLNDIQDLTLLPNLQEMDLSNNQIANVAPLHLLENLRKVDLSNNELESINMLSFSYAKEMYVNVAFNYIKDFSCFNTLTHCNFTIAGAGLQHNKSTFYFNVYQLFVDIDEKDKATVSYRGYTNMDAAATLRCGASSEPAALDGTYNTIYIPGAPTEMTKIFLTNGEQSDSTWMIPTSVYEIKQDVTIGIPLPEGYTFGYVGASHGTVSVEGNSFVYTATETSKSDVIEYAYYQGTRLRGFSRCYLVEDPTAIHAIEAMDDLNVRIQDKTLFITLPPQLTGPVHIAIYEASGKQLESQRVSHKDGSTYEVPVTSLSPGIYIVSINGKSKKFVIK